MEEKVEGKKEKEEKTPMQKAMGQIKTAYIAAFISAVLTFVVAVASIWVDLISGLNIFAIIDVAFIFVLAVLLVTIKSRIAAVILLIYYLFSQISMRIGNPDIGAGNIAMLLIFVWAYYQGIVGTFTYYRLRKAEKQELQ